MTQPDTNERLALDTSVMDKARAMHRVWRALNDGDCPKCHTFNGAHNVIRWKVGPSWPDSMECPECHFLIDGRDIEAIETLFAPAMDAAVAIFEEWRKSRE